MKPRLLFTGGTGFIGRSTLPKLASGFDISTLGRSAGSDFVYDLGRVVPRIDRTFDMVVHAAGLAHVGKSDCFMDVNFDGTRRLCRALEDNADMPADFIFISSVAVYGLSEGRDVTEDTAVNPSTAYGESKAAAEDFLIDWCEQCGVTLTILRPALIAGPDAPGNLGAMMRGLRSGRYISFGRGGGALKSVLALSDVARLIELSAGKGGIYNVCADTAPGFREIEARICSTYGYRYPVRVPGWVGRAMAPFSSKVAKILSPLTFSNARARTSLGWQPLPWDYDL